MIRSILDSNAIKQGFNLTLGGSACAASVLVGVGAVAGACKLTAKGYKRAKKEWNEKYGNSGENKKAS